MIINAPRIFAGVKSLLNLFLNEKTCKKINIVSTENTMEALLKVIDIENLPEFLGGTSK